MAVGSDSSSLVCDLEEIAGAEVDLVLQTSFETVIPIEVKFRNMKTLSISRGYRSFLEVYQPQQGFVITKNQSGILDYPHGKIYFIPLNHLPEMFQKIT